MPYYIIEQCIQSNNHHFSTLLVDQWPYQYNYNMDEVQQAREGLQVYLEANRQYIEEKVYNQFNVECIEMKNLNSLDVDKMKRVIKEIFDFGDNKVYSYFFSHLDSNIKNYIKEQYSTKAIASFYVLDIQKLTDIVKYCINHGFDFTIKKEPEKKKPRVEFIEEVKIVEPPKDEFAHIKPRISTFLDRDKIPQKKQFKIEKHEMPQLNVLPRYLANIAKPQIKQQQQLPLVEPLDDTYLLAHKKILQQRLQKLYNFYCYQGQSLGQGPTFDRILNQGKAMNLGKFMQFCQYTKVFQCDQISKQSLMADFKRISEGKIEILFQAFQRLIIILDEKYLKAMGHDPINNPIPTYEARLMLNEPTKLGELKKQRNLVFGTRNKEGREVRERAESTRYEKKQLTGHSGRFVNDLSLDLKQKQPIENSNSSKRVPAKVSDSTFQLNQLKKLKLPKLNWILQEEDEPILVKKKVQYK